MNTTRLFIDHRFIQQQLNIETALAPHKMHGKTLTIDGEDVWTKDHNHFSWYRDESGKFHGWRSIHLPDDQRLGDAANVYRVASDDGLSWRTVGGPTGFETVYHDTNEPDPKRRYKAVYQGVALLNDDGNVLVSRDDNAGLVKAANEGKTIHKGMFSAVSEDGLQWHDHRMIVVDKYSDSAGAWVPGANLGHNADLDGNKPEHRWWKPGEPGWCGGDNFPCLTYDPISKKYVAFFRTNIDRRTWRYPNPQRRERGTGRAECETFGEWSEHELVLRADPTWQRKMGHGAFDYYQLQVWPCANVWLGVVTVFHWTEDRTRLELVWSPDTVHWERVKPGEEIVPITTERSSPDFGGHYASMTPQRIGDEVWMYLGASDGLHNAEHSGDARLMLAKFQPDRFAGLASKGNLTGTIRTNAFTSSGALTMNASADEIKLAMCSADGEIVSETDVISGDSLSHQPVWRNSEAVKKQIGNDVTLRIEMRNACVYAVTI